MRLHINAEPEPTSSQSQLQTAPHSICQHRLTSTTCSRCLFHTMFWLSACASRQRHATSLVINKPATTATATMAPQRQLPTGPAGVSACSRRLALCRWHPPRKHSCGGWWRSRLRSCCCSVTASQQHCNGLHSRLHCIRCGSKHCAAYKLSSDLSTLHSAGKVPRRPRWRSKVLRGKKQSHLAIKPQPEWGTGALCTGTLHSGWYKAGLAGLVIQPRFCQVMQVETSHFTAKPLGQYFTSA
jgi:hypothetical protein